MSQPEAPASTPPSAGYKIWRWPLHWQIMLGLLVGCVLGYLSASSALDAVRAAGDPKLGAALAASIPASRWDYLTYNLLGDLFMRALKIVIVPLVVSSIVLAVVNIGKGAGFGRLSVKTLVYFMSTTLLAILIGLALIEMVKPGVGSDGKGILQGKDITVFAAEQTEIAGKTTGKNATDFLGIFRAMIPDNFIAAAADNGQLLGLIITSLVLGFVLVRIDNEGTRTVTRFVTGVYDVTLRITDMVLKIAPIGIAMLIAATVAKYYLRLAPDNRFTDFVTGIGLFAGTTFVALLIHFTVSFSLILLLIARVNPLRHYRAMMPALLTAFSTSSSSATLPVNIECVKNAGVSNRVAGFVLPMGATVNMDGTALYECVAAIFICQAFGVDLSFSQQFFIVVAALLTSIGVAGVPSASIVAIVVILESISAQLKQQGIDIALVTGLGLIWVFDRPLDMCRTAVNIFSDSVGAVVIAKSEGEKEVLTA